MRAWTAVLLVACGGAPEVEQYQLRVVDHLTPMRGGDPLGIVFEVERDVAGLSADPCEGEDTSWCGRDLSAVVPLLMSPEGEVVQAEAWLTADGRFLDFTLPAGAVPGIWAVAGGLELDLPLRDEVWFDIEDWGQAVPFAPTLVSGSWEVGEWRSVPLDLSSSFELPPAFVDIRDSDAEGAELRVVAETDGGLCVLLQTYAVWEGSELVYETERLAVTEPELGEIAAEEVRLAIAWSSQGYANALGTVDGRVDTFALDQLVNESEPGSGEACDLAVAVGAVCEPCADGEPDCLGVHLTQIELSATHPLAADLPLCGVDALGPLPTLSCDAPDLQIDCGDAGCSHLGRSYAWFTLWMVPWLIRRRSS